MADTGASRFETKRLPAEYTHIAPDKSEIRELAEMQSGGLAHCILPPGHVSQAIQHRSVDEIWFFLSGMGQVWRQQDDRSEVVDVQAALSLTIPCGTSFQFRNLGWEPLCFLILTMPPWPGPDEALHVKGRWQTT